MSGTFGKLPFADPGRPRDRIATHAANAGGSVCLRVLAAIGLVPGPLGGSFARRPQKAGKISIRKYPGDGRIDRSGERRIFQPPPKPSSQSKLGRAAAPPSRTPRKTAGAALRRAAPSPASSPTVRSVRRISHGPLNEFSKRKIEKTEIPNILNRCGRAVPRLVMRPKGPAETDGGTQKERPPALPQAAQV